MKKRKNPWITRAYNKGFEEGKKFANTVVAPRQSLTMGNIPGCAIEIINDTPGTLRVNIVDLPIYMADTEEEEGE